MKDKMHVQSWINAGYLEYTTTTTSVEAGGGGPRRRAWSRAPCPPSRGCSHRRSSSAPAQPEGRTVSQSEKDQILDRSHQRS